MGAFEQEKSVPVAPGAEALLARVEEMYALLEAWAHGSYSTGDDDTYAELRRLLLTQVRTRQATPGFVKELRNYGEFWDFIKARHRAWADRRVFLRSAFAPLLHSLEEDVWAPDGDGFEAALQRVDWLHVQDAWAKIRERLKEDPDGAITAARSLVESVCKHILDEANEPYDPKEGDLGALYRLTAKRLNLTAKQQEEQDEAFKPILSGCVSVVNGLASLRNSLGDAHGKGKRSWKAAPRHAELAANLAGAMASFLIATWQEKHAPQE